MNVHPLSSAAERTCAAIVTGVLTVLMVLLLCALRKEPLSLALIGFAAFLVAAALVFFLTSLFRASCRSVPESKCLLVRGLPDDTLDLSRAVAVKTTPCATGPVSTRTLVFSDGAGNPVATVPTFFTLRQGALAEPLAAALAGELGLTFLPSLEPWEYDKAKRAEHEKEVSAARRSARSAELRALKGKLFPKAAADISPEEDSYAQDSEAFQQSDNINYDALDDEK